MSASAIRAQDGVPAFAAPYAPPDEALAPALLAAASRGADAEARIDARARRLVEASAPRPAASAASRISCTPIRSRPRRAWR